MCLFVRGAYASSSFGARLVCCMDKQPSNTLVADALLTFVDTYPGRVATCVFLWQHWLRFPTHMGILVCACVCALLQRSSATTAMISYDYNQIGNGKLRSKRLISSLLSRTPARNLAEDLWQCHVNTWKPTPSCAFCGVPRAMRRLNRPKFVWLMGCQN